MTGFVMILLAATAPEGASPRFEAAARELVAELGAGKLSKVVGRFGPEMRQALPEQALSAAWKQAKAQFGAFQRIVGARVEPHPQFGIVEVECAFARGPGVVRVVLDRQLKVGGLFFKPGWSPPEYAAPSRFLERPVTVGSTALPLPGVLSLPRGKGPFPAVVLVHGSGPNDQDESVGANKTFKDLAWGLASREVAVLRYMKRTAQHRGRLSNADVPTLKEETLDDALSAVALLEKTPGIDPKRLFVVGHSLGALLAPRIAAADSRVRGIVMLAAPTRKVWHLVVEQTRYLTGMSGQSGPEVQKAIRAAEESARKLDDPKLAPTDLVDGIPGTYWLDLRSYDPVATLRELGRPALLLQGGRDYQVTLTDFEAWKEGMRGVKGVSLKQHPSLDHHFMPGTGPSSPADYQRPNHVAREVIEQVAGWISEQGAPTRAGP